TTDFTDAAGKYLRVERTWQGEQPVTLTFAMPARVKTWAAQKGNVSVYRGPLAYSVKIDEQTKSLGQGDLPSNAPKLLPGFPVTEIHPGSPWNYGLELEPADPAKSFEVVKRGWPADGQPFRFDASPVELRVRARRVPKWTLDKYQMPG